MNANPLSVLLDAGLLVLLVVGSADRAYIKRHKRTIMYSETDYELLLAIVSRFNRIVVTPNVLTEASNHCAQTGEPMKSRIMTRLAQVIGDCEEAYTPSATASNRAEFRRLGLADCVTIGRAADVDFTLTADFGLYQALLREGRAVENFNHLRERHL